MTTSVTPVGIYGSWRKGFVQIAVSHQLVGFLLDVLVEYFRDLLECLDIQFKFVVALVVVVENENPNFCLDKYNNKMKYIFKNFY